MKFNKLFEYSLIFKKMAFKVTRSELDLDINLVLIKKTVFVIKNAFTQDNQKN
jgi:hypothetical protein